MFDKSITGTGERLVNDEVSRDKDGLLCWLISVLYFPSLTMFYEWLERSTREKLALLLKSFVEIAEGGLLLKFYEGLISDL